MVTSPASNAIDWPERTEVIDQQRRRFRLRGPRGHGRRGAGPEPGPGLAPWLVPATSIGLPGWPAPGSSVPGLQAAPGRVSAFGADDVDAALLDRAHQRGDVRDFGGQGAEVDDHRPAVEEVRRPLDLRVQARTAMRAAAAPGTEPAP